MDSHASRGFEGLSAREAQRRIEPLIRPRARARGTLRTNEDCSRRPAQKPQKKSSNSLRLVIGAGARGGRTAPNAVISRKPPQTAVVLLLEFSTASLEAAPCFILPSGVWRSQSAPLASSPSRDHTCVNSRCRNPDPVRQF